MNMVTYATYCKRYRSFSADNASNKFKYTIQIFIANDDASAFRVKNNVRK